MTTPILRRADLRADCSNCFALCCTALGFSRSVDFPADKPAGTPCENLTPDYGCGIHDRLRGRGYRGCVTFDCFGAGQTVSQRLFAGTSWRAEPHSRRQMFAAFTVVKQLHEMAWHLLEAQTRAYDPDLADQAQWHLGTISALTDGPAADLLAADIVGLHAAVRALLMAVSAEIRASYQAEDPREVATDLAGADLRGQSLCGADLRGACLIAADLRGSDLAVADLLGADLRDARIAGADLSRALYLTQSQANSALGDARTRLPAGVTAPGHWGAAGSE